MSARPALEERAMSACLAQGHRITRLQLLHALALVTQGSIQHYQRLLFAPAAILHA